jgi:hypothetical protein
MLLQGLAFADFDTSACCCIEARAGERRARRPIAVPSPCKGEGTVTRTAFAAVSAYAAGSTAGAGAALPRSRSEPFSAITMVEE